MRSPSPFPSRASGDAGRRLLLAAAIAVAACQDAEIPLAPALDEPQFSHSPGHGLKGTIAFHSSRAGSFDIFVMNADGSGVTQLTNTPDHDIGPIWSPNGKQLAFGRFDASWFGGVKVMVMNADGSALTELIDNGFPSAWSPDGKRIAFASNLGLGDEIFIMSLDGTGVIQLTHNEVRDFPSAWSPDGKQILFQSDRDGNTELYVMNVDGTGVTRLTDDPASDEGDRAGWSPNGKQIVFSSRRDGGDLDLFVMNADGRGVRQLTFNDDIEDDDPVWSPNGAQIAFHSTRDGDEEIFVMNADGSGVTQLTFNEGIFDAVPAWSARPLARTICAPTTSGLVSWWSGDGSARDIVGGNHGQLFFDATFAPAKVRKGFSFDGVGDVVFAPGARIDGLQQLTIDAWVKHHSLPPGKIERYVTLIGEKAVLRHDGEAGPAQLHFYMSFGGALYHIRVNDALRVGVFHHVAGTYDGSDMRLYLDGVEVGSLTIAGQVDFGGGVEFSSESETLHGLLDEIEIFDRALDASEIRARFERCGANKCRDAR